MTDKDMYQQLAEFVGAKDSKIIHEILKKITDKKDMKLLLAASPPATTKELAEKTGISEDR